jgi:hypothetical protein
MENIGGELNGLVLYNGKIAKIYYLQHLITAAEALAGTFIDNTLTFADYRKIIGINTSLQVNGPQFTVFPSAGGGAEATFVRNTGITFSMVGISENDKVNFMIFELQ